MRKLLMGALLLASLNLFAQDEIPGYYINLSGKKVSGTFKKDDFSNSTNLRFRADKSGSFQKIASDSIAEIEIGRDVKFQRIKANMDRSRLEPGYIGDVASLDMGKKDIFANLLIAGDVSLYSVVESGGTRYLYKTKDSDVAEQLIYKKYLSAGQYVVVNDYFKQLYDVMPCNQVRNRTYLRQVKYEREDLIKLFTKYNRECVEEGSKYAKEYVDADGNRTKVRVAGVLGINHYNFEYNTSIPSATGSNNGLFVGVEAEVLFAHNSWAIYGMLDYASFNGDIENSGRFQGSYNASYEHKFKAGLIDINFGPRYYLNLSSKSRLYADLGVVFTFVTGDGYKMEWEITNNSGTYPQSSESIMTNNPFTVKAGVGYQYDSKYAIGLNYIMKRSFLPDINSLMEVNTLQFHVKYFFL